MHCEEQDDGLSTQQMDCEEQDDGLSMQTMDCEEQDDGLSMQTMDYEEHDGLSMQTMDCKDVRRWFVKDYSAGTERLVHLTGYSTQAAPLDSGTEKTLKYSSHNTIRY
jgi:hypothetical protein